MRRGAKISCNAVAGDTATCDSTWCWTNSWGISSHATRGMVGAIAMRGRRVVRRTRGVKDSCPVRVGCVRLESPLETERNLPGVVGTAAADSGGSKCPRNEACRSSRGGETFLLLLLLLVLRPSSSPGRTTITFVFSLVLSGACGAICVHCEEELADAAAESGVVLVASSAIPSSSASTMTDASIEASSIYCSVFLRK
eukprot:scaffold4223_cov189-Amphora_coffeaeformis.AAC.70